jgi:hypothetical protein
MNSLICVLMNIQLDDDPLRSQHVAINTTNTVVSTVFTLVVVRKHNWLSNFKIGTECLTMTYTGCHRRNIRILTMTFSVVCLSQSRIFQ